MNYPGHLLDGKPNYINKADCQQCARIYLPVLLVRPSVADARHAQVLAEASRLYDQLPDVAFARLPRQGTVPLARLLRRGYVYVFYQARGAWDVWRTYDDGTSRKLLELATSAQYAKSVRELARDNTGSACSRGAANVPAGLITLIGAATQPHIWLAYAAHLWDPEVLDAYGAARSASRAARMTHVNGKALIDQGCFPSMGRPLTQNTLETLLPEFNPTMPPAGPSYHPLLKVFKRAGSPLADNRFGQAGALSETARKLEATAGHGAAGKGMMLMLADPVGVAQDYNDIRLGIQEEHQHWMSGGPDATGRNADPDRPWKRQSMLCAGYLREWLRAPERERMQALHQRGAIKDTTTIAESEYRQVIAEAAAGRPRYPAGTTYERLDTVPVVYRVHWPASAVGQGLEDMAQARAQPRVDRYDSHLDEALIARTNQQWLEQEQGWHALLQARDHDYAAWLESDAVKTALRHDYADRTVLAEAVRQADQFDADLRNAMARVEAVARCYGGGACGPESLRHLLALFGKDENDPTHWLAAAAIQPFDLLDLVATDPGTQASVYDILVSNRQAVIEQFREGWEALRESGVAHLATLLLVSTQVTNQMRYLALAPEAAKQLGLASQLALARAKEGIWVRTAALLDFLDTGNRRYLVGIIAPKGPLAAANKSDPVTIGRIEPYPASSAGRKADRAAKRTATAKATLRGRGLAALEGSTVYLVFDQAELDALQRRPGGDAMVSVASHDLFGEPHLRRIPMDLAEELLREPQTSFARRLGAALGRPFEAEYRLPSLAAVVALALQARAFWQSLDDLTATGGVQRIEVAASIASSITGIAGAVMELAAIGLTRPLVTPYGAPAPATLGGELSWPQRLRLAGGFLTAGGAFFDAVAAYITAHDFDRKGDVAAAYAYRKQFGFQVLGGVDLLLGSGLAWYVARRLAVGASVRIGLTVAGGTFIATSTIAAWLSGIGLTLWIIGVGVSFWAMSLQDDAAEIWLDRSYFGKHRRSEGRFDDLEQELESFGALSWGVSADLIWDHNWTSDDEVRFTLTLPTARFELDAAYGVNYTLEGFTDRYTRKATDRLAEGGTSAPAMAGEPWVVSAHVPIGNPQTRSARLTYAFCQGDEVLAMDHLWIDK